jgi:2-hydroxycyclohexanecarboxyl-CoA dehydrogenase
MQTNLAGKSVIVTGGASNIGRAITLAFAAEGAAITIADLDEKKAEAVSGEAKKAGAKDAFGVKTDVTNNDSVIAMVKAAEQRYGRVDVLVNNVGWTVDRLFIDKKREEWEKEIQINLWGTINCTRAVLDGMIQRKGGSIVSIGSDAGRMGEFKEAVYGACKAGVIALTKSLAREYGRSGVRFNVVCPGMTMPASDDEISPLSMWNDAGLKSFNTPEMRQKIGQGYPLRRVGNADDVAPAVVFLASDGARYITGQTLSASGGYTMM